MSLATISEELQQTGLSVWPDFLSAQALRDTRADFGQIQAAGGFVRAKTGQGDQAGIQDLRRDEIHWLDRTTSTSAQAELWKKLDQMKQELNRSLFFGLTSFEGHYSSYGKGAFYRRHLDCFQNDDSRLVSFVLYLNQSWKAADGGQLRIYSESSHTDVDPVGGTMVCFMSRESEHEVLESFASRLSFTGWFKVDP